MGLLALRTSRSARNMCIDICCISGASFKYTVVLTEQSWGEYRIELSNDEKKKNHEKAIKKRKANANCSLTI